MSERAGGKSGVEVAPLPVSDQFPPGFTLKWRGEGWPMSRREKLLDKMKRTPGLIRYGEVESLLLHEGFVLFNSRGSHRAFHRTDGVVLTVVVPHGRHKTCNPTDIKRILEALGRS